MKKILCAAALAATLSASAATLVENFTADPATNGWSAFGQTNLFTWNPADHNLAVTWDSAQSNSFFHHNLGMNLSSASNFLFSFDLRLSDIAIGVDTNKPFTFQIALGLFNLAQATNSGFIRGSGYESPNLVEFDYFPDSGFGATVSTALISSNNEFNSGGFTFPLELVPATLYHVTMVYTANDRTLRTDMTSNGVPGGPIEDATLGTDYSDFLVDHFGVASYSDQGQFPGYEGSVLAHGTVDNLVFASPLPVTAVTGVMTNSHWETSLQSDAYWLYTLERSTNLTTWTAVTPPTPGNDDTLVLSDTNAPAAGAVYRVRADVQ